MSLKYTSERWIIQMISGQELMMSSCWVTLQVTPVVPRKLLIVCQEPLAIPLPSTHKFFWLFPVLMRLCVQAVATLPWLQNTRKKIAQGPSFPLNNWDDTFFMHYDQCFQVLSLAPGIARHHGRVIISEYQFV